MLFDKHRQRRLIFNDDGNQVWTEKNIDYGITDERSFLDARTTPTFQTQVDTYVWCVGNGAEPPYGPMTWGPLWPFIGTYERAADLVVETCHANDMEVWGSLRMNDLHDSIRADTLENAAEPIKAAHPEYLLGTNEDRELPSTFAEHYLWTALNFERPEVREYRLAYIRKNAARHDFDGYELDFTRFIWYFPLGKERECAPLMTDLIRKVRQSLDAIGAEPA